MQPLAIAGVLLALTPVGIAQGTTFPIGFRTTSAGGDSHSLGSSPTMRFQALYGDLQGSNIPHTFSSLEFRREATGRKNLGRTWSHFAIFVGDCDYTKVSDSFASNLRSKTMVFSGAVTWPNTVGVPATSPAAWGQFAVKDDMMFPFGAGGSNPTFVHSGQSGFGVEFEMSGGTLANSTTWQPHAAKDYYLDGIATNNQFSGGKYRVTAPGVACSSSFFAVWLFSDKLVGGGSQFRAQPFTVFGRPNTLHIGGVAVNTIQSTHVPILGSCNGLALDLSVRTIKLTYTTDALGQYFGPFLTAPFIAAAVGLTIDSQAAFSDSNGAFQMTRAGSATITPLPASLPTYYAARVYSYGPSALSDRFGLGPYPDRIPVISLR